MTSSTKNSSAGLSAANIDVVLFDYGQVLSAPPDPAAWSRMQTIAGLSDAQLHEAYWKFRHDYDRDTLSGLTYWREVARHADIELNEGQIEALMVADVDLWTQPNPPMIAWAGQLQRASVRTAVLSNIGDAMAAGVTARLDWLQRFERCIWSYALKLAKPEPAIFRETAEMLGAAPKSILFIDDKEENVQAASTMGMHAVQYSAHTEFEQEMRDRGFASLLLRPSQPASR